MSHVPPTAASDDREINSLASSADDFTDVILNFATSRQLYTCSLGGFRSNHASAGHRKLLGDLTVALCIGKRL